jgi:hypothetical protein
MNRTALVVFACGMAVGMIFATIVAYLVDLSVF